MISKKCQVGWLKTIFRINNDVPEDLVNWNDLVDGTLSYPENYNILYDYLKQRGFINEIE